MTSATPDDANKLTVVASFYPLFDFTQKVAGERAHVVNLVPPGVEVHDFELTPRDTALIYDADLVVYNGAGLEPWVEALVPQLRAKGIRTLEMGSYADLLKAAEDQAQEEYFVNDPHLWLDPVFAQKEVALIRDTLSTIDPAYKRFYQMNADAYLKKLKTLHADYVSRLKKCVRHEAVTSHNAFRYLAQRYKFNLIPIAGISPDEEPSAKKLAEISDLAREKGVTTVFFESFVSPKLAETLAREIGAKTLLLNTLEGLTDEERAAGKDYLALMRENLDHLGIAFDCQ